MEKKTKREILVELLDIPAISENEIYAEFCQNEIELLDKKAIKAKENAAKKRAEADELTDAVEAALSEESFESIAEITAKIEGADVTASKVTYRLTQLVKNGVAEKQEISIPGGEGQKARKIQGYRALNS